MGLPWVGGGILKYWNRGPMLMNLVWVDNNCHNHHDHPGWQFSLASHLQGSGILGPLLLLRLANFHTDLLTFSDGDDGDNNHHHLVNSYLLQCPQGHWSLDQDNYHNFPWTLAFFWLLSPNLLTYLNDRIHNDNNHNDNEGTMLMVFSN